MTMANINNKNNNEDYKQSPREDFNPLEDDHVTVAYLRQASNDNAKLEDDEDLDDDCPISEEEDEDEKMGQYRYGITPPAQPRVRIREKERQNETRNRYSLGSSDGALMKRQQLQARPSLNVIKNVYSDDPVLFHIGEFDSDDCLDPVKEKKDSKRKSAKKPWSKNRLYDRSEKRLSEDFSSITVGEGLSHSQIGGMKLESSGRFNLLKQTRPLLPLSPECRARRQTTEAPDCPQDREDFYKDFSTLIYLGTEAKRKEEKSSCKRQISVEQEQLRTSLIDQIWLELRSYINNEISPEEHMDFLKIERQKHDAVINDINNFCFADSLLLDETDSAFIREPSSANAFFRLKSKDESYREQVSRSVSASFSDVNLTDETVCLQEKALHEVQKLLDRLDHCESCYRTTKSFCQINERYRDPLFQRRVECLNLWLNITCDLCQKLKLFGRIIGAQARGSTWPLIKFNIPPQIQPKEYLASPRPSIPSIHRTLHSDTSDNNDGSDGDDESEGKTDTTEDKLSPEVEGKSRSPNSLKQVKFQQDQACCNPNASEPTSPIGCSTPIKTTSSIPSLGSFNNLSRASSELSLDDSLCRPSPYKHYVEKCLRKMGLKRLNVRLGNLFHDSLKRARQALVKHHDQVEPSSESTPVEDSELCHQDHCQSTSCQMPDWNDLFIRMGLPSFRPTYLFIVRIQVNVIHECLKTRKEQRPKGEPSFLSIRQLIRECKEVLNGATMVKQYFHFMVDAVMWDEHEAEEKFVTDLTEFDEDLKEVLDVYFSYLQNWIHMLQCLPEASLGMKSALEEEWAFTKSICASVIGGEAEAGKKFSSLASNLLSSIGDFLDNGIDTNTRNLYDDDILDDDDEEEEEEEEDNFEMREDGEQQSILESKKEKKMAQTKQNIQATLRNFKTLFNEARERASKALGFAKLLRKDLEIAADFNITVETHVLLNKLLETNHIQVLAPITAGYMMFIPECIISNKLLILQLLNVTLGQEESQDNSSNAREEGYLLMLRCESGTDHLQECPIWSGNVVHVEPTAETTIALSHIEVMGLLFVVTHSSVLTQQRRRFENCMGRQVQLINEQTSCHQSIAESLSGLKTNALDLMMKVSQAIKQVNEKLNSIEIIQQEENILKVYRETMIKIYDFGFEYQKDLMRLASRDQREKQCRMIVAFAKDWMEFVTNKCEYGRGIRPRWATQGLEFVSVVCEPKNIVYLDQAEFKEFQLLIGKCLNHIIGSIHPKTGGPGISYRSNLEVPRTMQRLSSCPENSRYNRSISARSAQSEIIGHHGDGHSSTGSMVSTPSSPGSSFFCDNRHGHNRHSIPELPEISVLDSGDGGIKLDLSPSHDCSEALGPLDRSQTRSERLQEGIEQLERKREKFLKEKKIIGTPANRVQEPDYRVNVRRVNFRWQRGIKIGEGQFGKVYTAVNINTGELMAMKEMKFQPNDQQSLKEMCDEIKNFEGINHKNLVKYFGVEVHKDDMLMFMEYCDSGSIEEVARIGLPEYMIRRYTLEIVQAVAHLHENNIVHRDIKGANIFLTSEGHVKLGDFGCSVKLKNQHTMPGENINMVGTTAYMAPEVITQNSREGHGRAADIWSLGCVVLEMATGKRPWHDLEHNLQVMFKVGFGHTPPIPPDCLSKDGQSFLRACLVHDTSVRWTALQLLDHLFVKVLDSEEDPN